MHVRTCMVRRDADADEMLGILVLGGPIQKCGWLHVGFR